MNLSVHFGFFDERETRIHIGEVLGWKRVSFKGELYVSNGALRKDRGIVTKN